MSAKRVRVLIAEDQGTVREGTRLLIEKEPDTEVIGEAADGREALLLALELQRPGSLTRGRLAVPERHGRCSLSSFT